MEPAGLALGVIGLAGIFKSCVELFGYFSTYRSYGHDYNLLDAKLHIEKAVLLQWADRVRLLHEDYDRRLDNPTIQEAVSHILSSIIHLLSETSSLQQRYGVEQRDEPRSQLLVSQSPAIGGSLMEKFMDDYNAMQLRIHHRKATTSTSSKLRWMIVDKDKFNTLIAELSHFTSKLDVLVPGDSSERAVSLLASLMRNEMASIYKENAKAVLQQATDGRLETNAILQEARDQDRALKSLWFRCMGDRKDSVEPAHVKTLQWALKPACEREKSEAEWDDLSEWLRSGTGVYWICGKAGSGKSTLMKYLHDNPDTRAPLNAWAGDLPLTVGSFFFWGLGTQEQKSLEGLSRAILYQLLEAESSYLPSALPRLWQEVRTNVHKEPEPPSSGELRAASEFMTKNFQPRRRFCLFIDGLDEFEGNFHDAIKWIRGLCSNSAIKVIVSSRPIAICYDAFSRVPQLHMESLTRNDIKEYISDVVGSHDYMEVLTASGEQSPNMIINKLIEKASGVFLWVILACRSILDGFAAHDTIQELCQRVDDLPPELEDLFVHMLNSVDRRYHEQMAKTLKLVYTDLRDIGTIRLYSSGYGLNTIELASFDRNDMDCTSSIPLERFPVHEAHKICSAMVARLRSRCGGLLQTNIRRNWGLEGINPGNCRPLTGQLSSQSPKSNAKPGLKYVILCWCSLREKCPWVAGSGTPFTNEFPEHSSVNFLHRAFFEFLDNPDVWNLAPLRISDPTFSVACALKGMELQLSYLYCKNGAHTYMLLGELRMIDHEPLKCVLPVLAKLVEYLSLRITQNAYSTEEPGDFSPFLDPAYNRSSPQLSLLMAVELDLVNTAGSLFLAFGTRALGPPCFPFPLLYHSLRLPVLSAIDELTLPGKEMSRLGYRVSGYLLSQGLSPNEVFVNERGLFTTPWREFILLQRGLFSTPWKEPVLLERELLDGSKEHSWSSEQFHRMIPCLLAMKAFIEHGAELDNVLPGIPTVEKFFDEEFDDVLPEDSSDDDPKESDIRQVKKDIMAAIAERRRIMAVETLASSAASEHDQGTDSRLDKVDTGSNPKPHIGHKLNLKAVQEPLWWLLVFVILALSIYMKPGLLSQVES